MPSAYCAAVSAKRTATGSEGDAPGLSTNLEQRQHGKTVDKLGRRDFLSLDDRLPDTLKAVAAVSPLYTVAEYEELVERGVLGGDDHVELLLGVIVSMAPQGPPHSAALTWADDAIRAAVAGRALIRIQMPFRAGPNSMPEPDIAVVATDASGYRAAHPSEALCVLEVSVTSLVMDRMTKAPVYAGAGVSQYCVVDVAHDVVHVHTDPEPDAARYRRTETHSRGERFELVSFPGTMLAVSDILGPQESG